MTARIPHTSERPAFFLTCSLILSLGGGFWTACHAASAASEPVKTLARTQKANVAELLLPAKSSQAKPVSGNAAGQAGTVSDKLPLSAATEAGSSSATPEMTAPEASPSLSSENSAQLDPEGGITLFENPAVSDQSPWGGLLSASVTKMSTLPIDLPAVLKLVEAQNLPLAQNRLNARIKNLTYYRSLSAMLPDIQGSYTQSRFQGSILVFGNATVNVYQTRLVPQLSATWVIHPGGEDLFTALAARQRAKGAKFAIQQSLNDQLTLAANAYYELLASSAQVENSRLSIQETASQVKLNEARLNAGIGTKLDLERARSQLVAREQILIEAENALARNQQSLLNVLNLDPEVALSPAQNPVQPHPLVPFELGTEQLLARAQANNPTLKITETELKALRDEARAALGRAVPAVTLQTYIGGLGPQMNQLGLTRFGGLSLQANLFDGLGTSIPLDYASRRLAVKQELLVRAQQVRDLQSQVINAYLDSRTAVKAIMAAQEQLSVAQEAYRLAFGRFKAGLGINVDVLDAQTVLGAARTILVRNILSFNQAQVRLLNALGDANTANILNGIPTNAFTNATAPKK